MKTKRSTFATSFYIKRSAVRNRDGKAPIMVKISIDGDDKALGTKLFVTPDLWENGKAKGKSAEATEINGQLKEVSARLTNHYHRILREEDFVTAEKLRNAFLANPLTTSTWPCTTILPPSFGRRRNEPIWLTRN